MKNQTSFPRIIVRDQIACVQINLNIPEIRPVVARICDCRYLISFLIAQLNTIFYPDKMKNFKRCFLIAFLNFVFICGFAQVPNSGDNPTLTKTIAPSPNAASLVKYGSMPVGYYTGIPSISIPLYEVTSGDISVPVSLDYHAGGVRVEELASWVGLSWSLNAGGVVSRTIRGVADDSHLSVDGLDYQGNINYLLDTVNHTPSQIQSKTNEVLLTGRADTEPDVYYFNFGHYSGKFFFGADGLTVYTMPQQKISIVAEKTGGVDRWIITTGDGIRYIFGKSTDGLRDGIEYNETYSVCDFNGGNYDSNKEISSWYLVEINSPKGYSVTFDYDADNYSYRTFANETAYYKDGSNSAALRTECTNRFNRCYVRNQLTGKRLRRINFLQGKIEFDVKPTYRLDVNDKALEYVRIYRGSDVTPAKYFKLSYSYFAPSTINQIPAEQTVYPQIDDGTPFRLKLISVTEYGSDNAPKPPHFFYYNEQQQLPKRIDTDYTSTESYGQDHWGYYNGQYNNITENGFPTLIPTIYHTLGSPVMQQIKGAERATIEPYVTAGVLQKIVYPSGGSTDFVFKANKVPANQFGSIYLQPGIVRVANAVLTSSSSQTTATATSEVFVVNSTLSVSGVFGGFATVYAQDHASGTDACLTSDPAAWRTIYRSSDNSVFLNTASLPDGAKFFLPNGSYYLKLEKKDDHFCNTIFDFKVTWTEYTSGQGVLSDAAVGGLRVEKISDYDGIDHKNDVVRYFKYQRFDNPSLSSGSLVSFPMYGWSSLDEYVENYIKKNLAPDSVTCTNDIFQCSFFVWQSYSNLPMATTQGSVVGYSNVTVEYGLNGANGKTEYTFTSPADYPDLSYSTVYNNYGSGYEFPYPSFCSFDWRRGHQLSEVNYRNSGGAFIPVTEERNYYHIRNQTTDPLQYTAVGMKVASRIKNINESCNGGAGLILQPSIAFYDTKTEWVTLDSTVTKTYDITDQTKYATVTQLFEYKPTHQQISRKTTRTSKDGEFVENFTYPEDYTGVSASSTGNARGIYLLQNKKMFQQVLEKYQVQQDRGGANAKVLSGEIHTFRENASAPNTVVADALLSLESIDPIPLTGTFVPSAISNGAFVTDANYKPRINFWQYDAQHANLLQQSKTGDVQVSYLWGYNNGLPIAEVKNATSDAIYHTSFEDSGVAFTDASNNNLAVSGSKVLNSGSFSFTGVFSPGSNTGLKMSYWYWNGSQWMFSGVMDFASSITAGQKLDEIRVFPAGAAMTTYTYDPLTSAMTTTTDENSQTTYYEYDSFGRLALVRDHNRNIVKKYTYH